MYWLSIFSIIGFLGLIGLIFWLSTTEVFIVELGSGTWWFALLLLALVVILSFTVLFHPYRYSFYAKLFNLALLMALISVVTYLGIEYQPFENIVVSERIGALFDFGGSAVDFSNLPPAKTEFIAPLPPVLDQGRCGSCWAYSAALSLSASLASPGPDPELACVEGTDVKDWRVSPQALLDLDTVGKCGGSFTKQGLVLARLYDLPDAKCVPGYSSAWRGSESSCKIACNSPSSNYCLLSQRNAAQHGFCADGSRAKRSNTLRSRSLTRVARSESSIRKAIQNYGPVVAWITFYDDGNTPLWCLTNRSIFGNKTRVDSKWVAMPQDDPNYKIQFDKPGHVMVIYGWGTRDDGVRFWLVRNSWGKNWGEYGSQEGSVKIQRGVNAWGIENEVYLLI